MVQNLCCNNQPAEDQLNVFVFVVNTECAKRLSTNFPIPWNGVEGSGSYPPPQSAQSQEDDPPANSTNITVELKCVDATPGQPKFFVKWTFQAPGCSYSDSTIAQGGLVQCSPLFVVGLISFQVPAICCGSDFTEPQTVSLSISGGPVLPAGKPPYVPPCREIFPPDKYSEDCCPDPEGPAVFSDDCCGASGGGHAGTGGPSEVLKHASGNPKKQPCCPADGGAGGCGGGGGGVGGAYQLGGSYRAPSCSIHPIRYATGELGLSATDIKSSGFSVPWGHTRSFASRLTVNDSVGNGYNWKIKEWPYLLEDRGTVVIQGKALGALWFDVVNGTYVPQWDIKKTLVRDNAAGLYRLYDLDGGRTDFDVDTGYFVRYVDPAGNSIESSGVLSNSFNFTQIERRYTESGVTTIEQYLYEYDTSSANPMLERVTLRSKVGSNDWANVVRVSHFP